VGGVQVAAAGGQLSGDAVVTAAHQQLHQVRGTAHRLAPPQKKEKKRFFLKIIRSFFISFQCKPVQAYNNPLKNVIRHIAN
jgi:hypothetical protein